MKRTIELTGMHKVLSVTSIEDFKIILRLWYQQNTQIAFRYYKVHAKRNKA